MSTKPPSKNPASSATATTATRVFIIESPAAKDITSGDRTGEHLKSLLQLLRIPAEYYPIHTKDLLADRLKLVGDAPVVHIAAHGRNGGMGFTDGTFMSREDLEKALLPNCKGKLVSLDFCDSSDFKPNDTLAALLAVLTKGKMGPPACVVTMFGEVKFADSLLSWGVFYRHLVKPVPQGKTVTPQRKIYDSLKKVQGADLHPMCAAFWYDKFDKFVNISPWKEGGEENVKRIAKGLAPPA